MLELLAKRILVGNKNSCAFKAAFLVERATIVIAKY